MNEYEYLAGIIHAQMEFDSPVVLISITNQQGSSPRHTGTKMAVGQGGKAYGTIGGSIIESESIKKAKHVLLAKKSKSVSYDLTSEDAKSGMICGGKAEVLLEYMAPTAENKEYITNWLKAMRQGKDFYLFTHVKGDAENIDVLGHTVLMVDGTNVSSSSLSDDDIHSLNSELHNISTTAVLPLGETSVIVDRVRRIKTLYIFGAGHVGEPTAYLAAMVGFRVVVIDDRAEYANSERFPKADEVRVITDFNNAFEGLEIDKDSSIVIVTRGHQYDKEVLEQALKTNAGYIGMISSRKKRDTIYQALLAEGITQEQLDRVYSPIGLDIGAETPEEIAVSIVSELVKVRSGQTT